MMNEDSVFTYLREHVRRNVGNYYPDLTSTGVPFLRATGLEQSRRSFRWEIEIDFAGIGETRTIVAKIHKKPTTQLMSEAISCHESVKAGRNEYERLCDVYSFISKAEDKKLGALRPLDYVPSVNAVITEKIDSSNLLEKIVRLDTLDGGRPYYEERIKNYVRSCANWLRLFHEKGAVDLDKQSYRFGEFADSLDLAMRRLRERGVGQGCLSFVTKHIKKEMLAVSTQYEESEVVGVHGDFQAKNIVVGNGKIYALDMEGQRAGLLYEDVARFMISLRLRSILAILKGFLVKEKYTRILQSEFLFSYFKNQAFSIGLLKFYLIKAIIQKWNRVCLANASLEQKAFRHRCFLKLMVNPLFMREIKHIVREDEYFQYGNILKNN